MNDAETERAERIRAAGARAAAEAEERRRILKSELRPVEFGGRDGPEPTRFGDWERKGIATDF